MSDKAIVGVLGFVGVIITLSVNAWVIRRDRLETLEQERTALRTALVAELKILKLSSEFGIEKIDNEGLPGEGGGVYVPIDLMSDVYNAFVPKIGILTSLEVEKVMWGYMSARTFRKNLTLLLGTTVFGEHHVKVPRNSIGGFHEMQKELLPKLDDAIKSLSRAEGRG